MWGILQGREIGEPRGGAAEDLGEPLDTLLVRYIDHAVVAKDIRQPVRTGVLLLNRPLRATQR